MIARLAALGLGAGLLAGCASLPGSTCPIADQALRQSVGGCDAAALVAAGRKYEDGDGVPQDYARAATLYRAAATAQPAVTYVYSPAVGKEAYGRVIPVHTGAGRAPSPEAQYRLALLHLDGNGVKQDTGRARKLLTSAAAAGYAPAVEMLASM